MKSFFGNTIYTGTEVLQKKWVNFEKGKFVSLTDDPQGEKAGRAKVVTPAFIDPHCHIGMIRDGEPSSEGEANDKMDSIIPAADALDSVQMDDGALQNAIESGVLYSCVLPGSGNIIGGRSAFIRNFGRDTSSALIRRTGIKGAFGYNTSISTNSWKGTRAFTRMGAVAHLRRSLSAVQQKLDHPKEDSPLTIDEQVLADLLEGREVFRVHVHKGDDIASLLRVVDEFGLKITVEHGMDVHQLETFQELAKRNIPVIYGPIDSLSYKTELKHKTWRNIRLLLEAGGEFGLMTDHPVHQQSTLLYVLRHFLRCGVTKQQALEIITRRNAAVIGVDDILGTIESGKWASFTAWNGDPFDIASYPVKVFGEGEMLPLE